MQKVVRVISVLLPIMLLISLVGCATIRDEVDVQPSEGSLDELTQPLASDREVPANYITHVDSTGLFSVSYPPDWEENPNPRGVDLLSTNYVSESLKSGNPMEQWGYIFFWGIPTKIGFHPSCNIVVEPLPATINSIQQVMEEQIAMMNAVFDEFKELSLQTLVNDGRESAVLEYKAIMNGVEIQSLILVTIVGDTIWTNGCLVKLAEADFSEYETDFHNMVRSLRVYK